ncbi:hypothetical protein [Dactylococcopsis salina]|uniref:hypothetical protein n=1 Tax=Dactylococcopsis salina TaxID=292566 RepID=UPI0012E9ECF6|nr:hypothetical protein [Dactylococcopsis salina]
MIKGLLGCAFGFTQPTACVGLRFWLYSTYGLCWVTLLASPNLRLVLGYASGFTEPTACVGLRFWLHPTYGGQS